jgi:4a-hydroxytetrahydrobiopterin dehydratase
MPSPLAERHCVPCRGGTPPLPGAERDRLLGQLGGGWAISDGVHLLKEYRFPDFAEALGFVNRLGAVAEAEGHHPDIELTWGRVVVRIWTHAINGLTESDFVLAAKADAVRGDLPAP